MEQLTEQFAICHTDGCTNQGQGISVLTEPDALVVCGVCGITVTDLADTPPELPTEIPAWLT